ANMISTHFPAAFLVFGSSRNIPGTSFVFLGSFVIIMTRIVFLSQPIFLSEIGQKKGKEQEGWALHQKKQKTARKRPFCLHVNLTPPVW
ncbi:MAG: hypothetical protein IKM64_07565, partial [Clostridia bacterium]|nr:hypothetical protein [Clostridia bacterium]